MGASDGSASALRVELDKSWEINGQCAEADDDSSYSQEDIEPVFS